MNMQTIKRPDMKKSPLEDLAKGLEKVKKVMKEILTPSPIPYEKELLIMNGVRIKESDVIKMNGLLNSFYAQTRVYEVDVKKIYENIPNELVTAVEVLVKDDSFSTYEEILKRFMDISACVNNPLIKGLDLQPKIDNLFGTDLIDCNSFNVNRGSLAIIWSAMLLNLYAKYSSSIVGFEKKRIVRGCIALALGVGVGFLQFCHKSPESLTNYVRLLSEGYNTIQDKYNQRNERKIPEILILSTPHKTLSYLTDNEKLSVGQALNMSYTFRIGDAFLASLEGLGRSNCLSEDIIFNMIDSAWPTPSKNEIEKMYRLYTETYIYYL